LELNNVGGLVPTEVVRVARDLTSTDASVRTRAAWSLLEPGVLDCAWNSRRTRRAVLANDIPITDDLSDRLATAASILDRLPELRRDSDMRVRVAAKEASLLLRAWEDIDTGRTQRPLLEGVPVKSLAILRVYRDDRSHWLRPVMRFAKRVSAALWVRLPLRRKRRS
jgi:hypothetical protein